MFNIVVFGPPGCGKGTQSKNISKEFGWTHISTGDILREQISKNTKEGFLAVKYIAEGHLVPDLLIIKLLGKAISKAKDSGGIIFDGFPRTLYQARFLDKMLYKYCMEVNMVLAVEVSNEEIFKRIIGRSSHSNRRDDKREIIEERLKTYKEMTYPVMQYYLDQEKFTMVSGMAEEKVVFDRIKRSINIFQQFPPLR